MIETKAFVKISSISFAPCFGGLGSECRDIRSPDSLAFCRPVPEIVVLKLGRFEDFVIVQPRSESMAVVIYLMRGRLHGTNAVVRGLIDEFYSFKSFPEWPHSQDTNIDAINHFEQAVLESNDVEPCLRAITVQHFREVTKNYGRASALRLRTGSVSFIVNPERTGRFPAKRAAAAGNEFGVG